MLCKTFHFFFCYLSGNSGWSSLQLMKLLRHSSCRIGSALQLVFFFNSLGGDKKKQAWGTGVQYISLADSTVLGDYGEPWPISQVGFVTGRTNGEVRRGLGQLWFNNPDTYNTSAMGCWPPDLTVSSPPLRPQITYHDVQNYRNMCRNIYSKSVLKSDVTPDWMTSANDQSRKVRPLRLGLHEATTKREILHRIAGMNSL